MNRPNYFHLIGMFACCGLLALGSVQTVEAASVARLFFQNGGNACTGARPTYEGALRKRPKAIANEGDIPAFITCSTVANDSNSSPPKKVEVFVTNRSTAPVELSCTMVNGDELSGSSYVVNTVQLGVGEPQKLAWVPILPASTFSRHAIGVSCLLPPLVELDIFSYEVDEDIGA